MAPRATPLPDGGESAPSAARSAPPTSAGHIVAPGTLIAERYRVESMLGEGGMGIVYLAEHIHMRKRVALKVLLPQWTTTPEVVARFEREAVAAGAIAHPNVAAATDFGRLADGSFFLVLEYLEGRTLRDDLDAGALPPARALGIARGIALGVGAAHAKGIVHRDLKPENVMIVVRGEDQAFVKVLDFGIARLDGGLTANGHPLTSAGAILGTPDYMAPEQVLGGDVNHLADLYALGVILFEMLTGECPFRGGAATLLRQHVLNPPPALPADVADHAPAEVRALVARLLAKDPQARYANATEVLAALDYCIATLEPARVAASRVTDEGRETIARAATILQTRAKEVIVGAIERHRRRPLLAVVGATGLLLIVASYFAWSSRASSPAAEPSAEIVLPLPPARHPRAAASSSKAAPLSSSPAATAELPAPPASSAPEKRAARRTGPGGIYVPPPSTWFK